MSRFVSVRLTYEIVYSEMILIPWLIRCDAPPHHHVGKVTLPECC